MTTSTQLPSTALTSRADLIHRRRWAILAVLSLSVFVTVLDGTIVNVALPSLAVELGASTRQLQWIVDAYLLVFTGLLLAAGGLGDRFGRKRALVLGLALFGATSAFAGSASSANELIFGRALMGIGAALIFPATLAILTNVFTDRSERAKAIGVWSAVTGLAVAAGPITGGWLLDHYWWGSVFYINVPVVIVAVLAAVVLVPDSREEHAPALDGVGLLLSITSIGALVLTIIEAPEWGWLSGRTLVGFIIAGALITSFIRWELHTTHPMMPVRIFRNLRFSAASVAITSAFFALFGFIFLVTQYFQLVRGYTPLESGVRDPARRLLDRLRIRHGTSRRRTSRHQTCRDDRSGADGHCLHLGLHELGNDALSRHRGADDPARRWPRPDHSTGHRVDHGLTFGGQGRDRLGGQRHHP